MHFNNYYSNDFVLSLHNYYIGTHTIYCVTIAVVETIVLLYVLLAVFIMLLTLQGE